MRLRPNIFGCRTAAVGSLVLLAASPAHAQHVHGVIELGIVLEENALAVSVRAPLADLVGFEHAAKNEQQEQRLRQAAELLDDVERMFGIPARAECVIRDVTIDAPSFLYASGDDEAQHADHEQDHHHDDHDDHDDHGDHDDHDDHDDDHHHDHDHHDEHDKHDTHSEVDAQYIWECTAPSQIDVIESRFTQEFENVEQVTIQIISSSGARVINADGRIDTIAVAGP